MQAVRRSHVDAVVEQAMNEAGIELRIHVRAVVTIVVDGITLGEVNLEHGSKALHDGFYFVAAKNFAQACRWQRAHAVKFPIRVFGANKSRLAATTFMVSRCPLKVP